MLTVTQESPEHFHAVRQLTTEAFAASHLGYHGEADLIDAIRNQCDGAISLVAIHKGHVVGHIVFSPAEIRTNSATVYGMGLAPMAVLPDYQGRGIGSMLVREGLSRVARTGAAFTLVAGHAEFYPRFGFRPAGELAVTHGFADMPQNLLFIRLSDDLLSKRLAGGQAYYHSAFGPQHAE